MVIESLADAEYVRVNIGDSESVAVTSPLRDCMAEGSADLDALRDTEGDEEAIALLETLRDADGDHVDLTDLDGDSAPEPVLEFASEGLEVPLEEIDFETYAEKDLEREEIADTVSDSLWLGEIESVLVRVCDFEDCEVDERD